jgi:hypothetical protein
MVKEQSLHSLGGLVNIPAKYRIAIYWIVLVGSAGFVVGSGFGVIPQEAIDRGVAAGLQLVSLIGAVLALRNITPDE